MPELIANSWNYLYRTIIGSEYRWPLIPPDYTFTFLNQFKINKIIKNPKYLIIKAVVWFTARFLTSFLSWIYIIYWVKFEKDIFYECCKENKHTIHDIYYKAGCELTLHF